MNFWLRSAALFLGVVDPSRQGAWLPLAVLGEANVRPLHSDSPTALCTSPMPPRRRVQYTQDSIDQQLQQIHLLDQSSSSENLEQLGPIIKQIHVNRQQEAFLRTLQGLVESKEAEIEKICADNYQDFVNSVSTLFTIKSYTTNLRDKISTLDSSVTQVGRSLVEKKKALLQTKKTASNLDEAIDNLQACLKVLDVVNRVGQMIQEEKYWSALRVSKLCLWKSLPWL